MSIALNVITGFLGSGKTSLLTRLLQGESLGDTALLINEFGDVGIDHLLVEEVAPDTVLLPGGCVCCSIRGELKDALLSLLQRRERGEIPAFKRVILETTGLADPAPILATLNNDVQLRGRVHIGLDQLWQAAETMLGRPLDPLDPQLLNHLENTPCFP